MGKWWHLWSVPNSHTCCVVIAHVAGTLSPRVFLHSTITEVTMQSILDRLLQNDEVDLTSLVPIRKVVTINGVKYLLCEADGEAVRLYKNLSMRAAKYNAEGKIETIEGLADVETQLVGDCLYTINSKGDPDKKVGLTFAKRLGNRILKPFFEFVKKVSEIDDEQETIEFLEKRIDSDTKKIEKLRKENPLKNGQSHTATSTSSVDSSTDPSTS